MNAKDLKTVDLFSGAGGLVSGFERAGFNVVASFESWNDAVEVLKKNFNHDIVELDLSYSKTVSEAVGKYEPDIIMGGPPCQDFSLAGNRKEGERASLTVDFAKIIIDVSPKMFLFENVARARFSNAYSDMKELLSNAGYGFSETIINAWDLGVPQKRKRFFCFGKKEANNGFMDEFIFDYVEKTRKRLSVREYFKSIGYDYEKEFYYRHPRTYGARAVFSVDEPSPTIRGVNPAVPRTYRIHEKDLCSDFSKFRSLTYQERSHIQTFPVDFSWVGKKGSVEKMIGNAVPPLLSYHLAVMLKENIQ